MSNLNKDQVIKKWSPIMDALKIKDSKKRDFLSEYAEHHQEIESPGITMWNPNLTIHKKIPKITHPDIDPFGEENWDEEPSEKFDNSIRGSGPENNMLPMSLKILSKLNLEGKNLSIEEDLPTVAISSSISKNQMDDLLFARGVDVVSMIESTLIEELAFNINRQLETHDNLKVNLMAQSVKVISENTFAPRITLTSKFKVD